jgi:DNA-binding GntR family transcriptional regulator
MGSEAVKINNRKTNNKKPLGITAYEKIYEKIITLEYKPGQNLEVNQVMNHVDLGRTPVRDALLRLAGEKIVESQPGKGFMVPSITLQNTKATFEMMKILETGAAKLAIRQDATSFLPKLEKAQQDIKAAIEAMDVLRLVKSNHDFHLYFAKCSYNEYLVRWINEIRSEAKRLSYLSYSHEIDSSKSLKAHYDSVIQEHEDIITYLKERDENKLKRAILEHIETFQRRIILYMSS